MEYYPVALASLLIAGVRYPVLSAVTGAVWSLSRVAYAVGYTDKNRDDGKGRYYGGLGQVHLVAQLLLLGLVGKMGFDMIVA